MKMNQIKVLVFGIWGLIILLGAVLFFSGAWRSLLPASQGVQAASGFEEPAASPTPQSLSAIGGAEPAQSVLTELSTLTPPPQPTLRATSTPLPVYNPEPVASLAAPGIINPLTGLVSTNPALLERRAIAVKMVNYPRSMRPNQSGLSLADVVWEHYIEDGISRYVSIFYGNEPTRAGPVRSGRFFDEHLMRMYNSYLVFANADDRVEDYLISTDLLPFLVVPRPDNCPPVCRDTTILGFNNVFVDISGMHTWLAKAGKDDARQPLRTGYFSGAALPWMGQDAATIHIRFSGYAYAAWEYDPSLGEWLRWQDTADAIGGAPEKYEPLYDDLTGERVTADNVVVLFVKHFAYNKDDQVYDIQLVGDGKAYLFRDGKAYNVKWVRDKVDQPIVITDPAGNLMALKPGNTFYEVITDLSEVTQTDTDFRFRFALPP